MSSLFDFPTNDPSYVHRRTAMRLSRRHPESGLSGTLPLDRPHQFKIFGNYARWRIVVRHRPQFQLGQALTPLAAQPVYGHGGEFLTARGSGFATATACDAVRESG
jgi:hypothetical protein